MVGCSDNGNDENGSVDDDNDTLLMSEACRNIVLSLSLMKEQWMMTVMTMR